MMYNIYDENIKIIIISIIIIQNQSNLYLINILFSVGRREEIQKGKNPVC